MDLLQVLMSWASRLAMLFSVLFVMLTFVADRTGASFSRTSLRVAHLLSFSTWLGTSVWVSFIAGVVLMNAVNMDNFGLAQAKLFDAYFRFSFLCLAMAGFSGAGLGYKKDDSDSESPPAAMSVIPFFIAMVSVMINLFFLSPQTTITMMERRRVCRELGVDRKSMDPRVRKLSKRFGMFHGICVLLNMLAMACGFIHVCTLAGQLDL